MAIMETMSTANPPGLLAEFLRSRRAALRPDELSLPTYGSRRVPGLRREELAQLAGVSATYYTRLEQGSAVTASTQVLTALAAALRLTPDEWAYLLSIARPQPRGAVDDEPEAVAAGMAQLLAVIDAPAVVLDRKNDVLAWNPLGHALVGSHLDYLAPRRADRPNLTRMLFLHQATRDMYLDWADEARLAIASLRLVAGRFADDRELNQLIGELSVRSTEFARLWAGHEVARCTSGVKRLDHPVAGRFDVGFSVLHAPDARGQRLLTHTPLDDAGELALDRLRDR